MNKALRLCTNMQFRQSVLWQGSVDSIYGEMIDDVSWSAWREALRLYRLRRDYDVVITMGIRASMIYATLCTATGVASKQVMTEVFIDAPQLHRITWRIKTAFYRFLARRALGILTSSSAEVASTATRFDLPRERLRFIPLCSTLRPQQTSEQMPPYVLSAGRTLRDYALIAKAARALDAPIVIVCGPDDLQHVDLPHNVVVHREIARDAYVDLLRRSGVVALPLLPTSRSTGQVVMLEAMACGKPVITTRSPGTLDYIQDGENGLFIEPGDGAGLINACRLLLADADRRRRLGEAAREMVRAYTYDDYARAALAAITNFHEGAAEKT